MTSLTSSSSSSIVRGNLSIHGHQSHGVSAAPRRMSVPGSHGLSSLQKGPIVSAKIRSRSAQNESAAQIPTWTSQSTLLNPKWHARPQSDTVVPYGWQRCSIKSDITGCFPRNSRFSFRSTRTAPVILPSSKSELCSFEPPSRSVALDPRFGLPVGNLKYFSSGCHNRFCIPRTTMQPVSQKDLVGPMKLANGASSGNAVKPDVEALPSSPKSQCSASKVSSSRSMSFLTDIGSPKNSRSIVSDATENSGASMTNIPPAFSARVAQALKVMGASSIGKPCRSLPCSPTNRQLQHSWFAGQTEYGRPTSPASVFPNRSTICASTKLELNKLAATQRSSSTLFLTGSSPRRARVSRVESEPAMAEILVPDEVPILLAQMNDSSQYVNEYENKLRITRQALNKLDNEWRSTREKIIAGIGTNHIQRADQYYTKLRELQHKKEHCTRLTQRYAHLSTTIDQMNKRHVASERELRWLEIREAKARKVTADIEHQMRTSMEAVNKLQQELTVLSQEYPLSIKKAEDFFSKYSVYLDGRKNAMREQKDAELKISENKELYKSAMNGLEKLSREIHEQRGTLDAATKRGIEVR